MSLESLLKIGRLKAHPPDAREIEQLVAAARRNLTDARVTSISAETRFDATYKAIMQSSLAALMLHEHCIAEAQQLIDDVVSWRASKRPGLVPRT